MAEKRRGLGRGLGALIPSAPEEEVREQTHPVPRVDPEESITESDDAASRKQSGRPADLFFERVTAEDVAEQRRSYSSALRSGINKNVLDAQSKRVARPSKQDPVNQKQASNANAPVSKVDVSPSLKKDETGLVLSPTTEGANRGQVEKTAPDRDTTDNVGSVTEDVSRETTVPSAGSTNTGAVDMPAATSAAGEAASGLVAVPGATFAELPIGSIHPNRKQPRVEFNEDELAELVHSIREVGVLQPVVVRPSQENDETEFELVMGERRWRASREAGLETIPAIIRSTLDDDLLRDALLENLHRSALNPLEEAAAYQQLLEDFGCSHDELAGRLGRSRPQISNTLRLMKLPPMVQRRVAAGILSAGHARALLGLADGAEMEKLAQRIVAEGLSVRSTEEIVALSGGLRRASKPASPKDGARHERLDYLATSLSDRLDTSVKITLGAKKGRVSIEFASVDDLNRIIGVLSPSPE
ncbi:ParB/RepB/Spo0J family partition protein [Arthrobacter cheniae]|jgi:ParB family chromosome partitioning protein|uniref:ParB/RepB/Spo0J family partition protein n=1 Tax=Arthrobacter cheniae TaxID=1258888 RepID=A0A3A5M899_9MICC|nr:ParB/RepB/Spo0J family partition protein [Arthrobacter cheniae]RJT80203.1 ParB/RepB/Spo0J family partition protein [Arthrobacter cheniae]